MTAYAPRHAVTRDPFFRRLRWRRERPVPAAIGAAGAGTALLAAPAAFTCCTHCDVPTMCEPPDAHKEPCSGGCNQPRVLALSQVREQWNAWHDDTMPSFTPARPVFTPSSAMTTGELAVLDAKVDAVLRPGHDVTTRPRLHPELSRQFTDRPGRDVLRRVLGGLRNWDPKPVQGEAPQDTVDEAQRLAGVMQQ